MAKNTIYADPRVIELAAPYDVTSGQGLLVGATFGVAQIDALSGATVSAMITGMHDLTKEPSLAISVGVRVFWDNTNKRVTTTTTSNFCIGVAAVAALAADTTVRVLLGPRPAAGA